MEYEEEDLYDCEIYTNEVLNSDEEDEENNILNPDGEIIYLCTNCGFVYNTKEKVTDYKGRRININDYFLPELPGYFRCPVCSKIVQYANISKEEYDIIVEAKRKKEEKKQRELERKEKKRKDAYFRINIAKFNHSLIELQKDLEKELYENENMSADRFSKIYEREASELYDKYSKIFKEADRSFPAQEFQAITRIIDKNIVNEYKREKNIEEQLDEREQELDDNFNLNDEIYLKEKEKLINNEKLYDMSMDEEEFIRQEKLDDAQKDLEQRHQKLVEEDNKKRKDLEFKKEKESKYNEKKKEKLSDINKGKIDDIAKSININNN